MVGFGLSVGSFVLLIFTAILSFFSYRFQLRASIRESIEQLDDLRLTSSQKVKPILQSFSYRPHPLNSKTELLLQFNQLGQEAGTSSPMTPLNWLDDRSSEQFLDSLNSLDHICEVDRQDEGIVVKIPSKNSVEIRNKTIDIFKSIKQNCDQNM